MIARDGFEHCPRCAAPRPSLAGGRFDCVACGWVFYRNTAAAVFVIAEHHGRVLLVRRAREPAAGTLDLPGGFIDPGETAEAALARELHEELGVGIGDLRYVGSYPNVYPYAGVTYHTLDLCFRAELGREPRPAEMDTSELEAFVLLAPQAIRLEDVGLDSPRRALADYLRGTVAAT